MSLIESLSSTAKIVGGVPAEAGRYPYQAAIFEAPEDVGLIFCAGTLIAPNIVLSAAHCGSDFENGATVALGCADFNDLDNCEVIPIHSHRVYDMPGHHVDIMLLLLQEDSKQTPIALAAPGFDLKAGQDLTIIGWGSTDLSTGENSHGILLEASVEFIDPDACTAQYASLNMEVSNREICALADGRDTCQGDSGGPIFVRCDASGMDVQVGVVSWGLGCAYDGIPGVYAKVFSPEAFGFIEKFVTEQGQTLTTVSSSEDFCRFGGTQPPNEFSDPPTPFPSFDLSKWTCKRARFAAGDDCDCNCGVQDPDCEYSQIIKNCPPGNACKDGLCVEGDITNFPTASPVPPVPGWDCEPKAFDGKNGCDCECGLVDPDCEDASLPIFNCDFGQFCDNGVCANRSTSAPIPYSAAWTCAVQNFGSGDGCDCNCGVHDPDCDTDNEQQVFNCGKGEICDNGVCATGPTSAPTQNSAGWTCAVPDLFALIRVLIGLRILSIYYSA